MSLPEEASNLNQSPEEVHLPSQQDVRAETSLSVGAQAQTPELVVDLQTTPQLDEKEVVSTVSEVMMDPAESENAPVRIINDNLA